jgi:T-complex protein 1 subunit theta
LKELVVSELKDMRDEAAVKSAIKSCFSSKQLGNEDFLSNLVVNACSKRLNLYQNTNRSFENQKCVPFLFLLQVGAMKDGAPFNVDNIRVCKILGSGVLNSTVMQGMVLKREAEGTVTKATNCKIGLFSCPFDISTTETKVEICFIQLAHSHATMVICNYIESDLKGHRSVENC